MQRYEAVKSLILKKLIGFYSARKIQSKTAAFFTVN